MIKYLIPLLFLTSCAIKNPFRGSEYYQQELYRELKKGMKICYATTRHDGVNSSKNYYDCIDVYFKIVIHD